MINILDNNKVECCGCGACNQVCPQQCIEMLSDEEGFLYPVVDKDKCIGCNLCEKVCPIANSGEKESDNTVVFKEPEAYGGWHLDSDVRADSSSGGAFSLFAEYILDKGGIVFGCTLDSDMRAVHIGINSKDELHRLRGSKYVQSIIGDVYGQIKDELINERKVLFVGTPCQVAGLRSFLGKEHSELYTIDFICHGVPSPALFAQYICELEDRNNATVRSFKFRNKDYGWNQSGLQLGTEVIFDDGTRERKYPAFRDSYMNAFLDDVCLRPSCYECRFKTIPKGYADFTIADFWGVDKVDKELNDKKGTSLILVNSSHGKELWKKVNKDFFYKEVHYSSALRKNPTLFKSSKENCNRDSFFEDFNSRGFTYVEKKYMSALQWFIHKITSILLNKFGQFIKFGFVGISNTVISLAVYYLLLCFKVNYLIAYTMGFFASVCNAFYWNSKYVFKNKHEKSLLKAFIKTFVSYGVSFLLSIVLMSLLVEKFRISSVIAPLLKMVITIPLNFVLNKVWAFKDKK